MRTWLRLGLCAAGLVISVYLTALHYDTHIPLVCRAVGIVDCEGVLTSPQSSILGVPVALFGVLWFVVMGALIAAGDLGDGSARAADLGLVWTLVGAISVAYLVYTELGVIGRICIWCTSVHVIVLVLFAMQALQPRAT